MLNNPINILLPEAKKQEWVRRGVHPNSCNLTALLDVKWGILIYLDSTAQSQLMETGDCI